MCVCGGGGGGGWGGAFYNLVVSERVAKFKFLIGSQKQAV